MEGPGLLAGFDAGRPDLVGGVSPAEEGPQGDPPASRREGARAPPGGLRTWPDSLWKGEGETPADPLPVGHARTPRPEAAPQ